MNNILHTALSESADTSGDVTNQLREGKGVGDHKLETKTSHITRGQDDPKLRLHSLVKSRGNGRRYAQDLDSMYTEVYNKWYLSSVRVNYALTGVWRDKLLIKQRNDILAFVKDGFSQFKRVMPLPVDLMLHIAGFLGNNYTSHTQLLYYICGFPYSKQPYLRCGTCTGDGVCQVYPTIVTTTRIKERYGLDDVKQFRHWVERYDRELKIPAIGEGGRRWAVVRWPAEECTGARPLFICSSCDRYPFDMITDDGFW
jgi:hypothetical protein